MSEELQQRLRTQLWDVANKLRGNMSAGDFMYFTLGFIFYKYLSEKIELYINDQLSEDNLTFKQAWSSDDEELKAEIKRICMEDLGYFIEPEYLYSSVIEAIAHKENILPQLERSLKKIEDSTIGHESVDDFGGLFSDIDLASPKLGKTADDKNKLISDVLVALNGIDFGLNEGLPVDLTMASCSSRAWNAASASLSTSLPRMLGIPSWPTDICTSTASGCPVLSRDTGIPVICWTPAFRTARQKGRKACASCHPLRRSLSCLTLSF